METKISIILTTFNRAHLVAEMLQSVINQTYINWECIVIDDNSSDATITEIKKNINYDDRFKLIIKPKQFPQGLPASRNIGIKEAKGDYIIFFDDDDVVHPNLLSICLETFKKDLKLSFVNYQKKTFKGEFDYTLLKKSPNFKISLLGENIYEKVIIQKHLMASCTVMWKIKLLKDNLFKEDLMYAEEWECYSRILYKNKNIIIGALIDIPLYFNRKHLSSNTGEFWSGNTKRLKSKIKALKYIGHLLQINHSTPNSIMKYFIHQSYAFNDKQIYKSLLNNNNRLYLNLQYWIYPVKLRVYKILKKMTVKDLFNN